MNKPGNIKVVIKDSGYPGDLEFIGNSGVIITSEEIEINGKKETQFHTGIVGYFSLNSLKQYVMEMIDKVIPDLMKQIERFDGNTVFDVEQAIGSIPKEDTIDVQKLFEEILAKKKEQQNGDKSEESPN